MLDDLKSRSTARTATAMPISLDQVKAFLRVAHKGEDALISDLLAAAGTYLEQVSGLALSQRDFQTCWTRWPAALNARGAVLPMGPVTSLKSVVREDADTGMTDLTAHFRLDCGRVYLRAWSACPKLQPGDVVRVAYMAGFAPYCQQDGACGLPADLRQAVLVMCSAMYHARISPQAMDLPVPDEVVEILHARMGARL